MTNRADATERKPLITRDTVVPLGLMVSIVGIAVVSAWSVSGALHTSNSENQRRFELIEQRLGFIDHRLEEAGRDRWHRTDMTTWVELLRAKNPDLNVPDIR